MNSEGSHVIIRRTDGLYERHAILECPYCSLPIAYTVANSLDEQQKQPITTYIYPRSLSSKQLHWPESWKQDIQQKQYQHN